MIDEPILITGCARSGTSMTAGIIRICGAFGGDTSGPNTYNPKGMFENVVIRNDIVKPYLRSIGADPFAQYPLPTYDDVVDPEVPWRKQIVDVLTMQGYDPKWTWFYKGAKMCHMFRLWHEAFPKAKWIIVRRPAEDIIASCLRTPFMRAFKDIDGWQSWIDIHLSSFRLMETCGLDVTEIWSNDLIAGDYEALKQFIKRCGLDWNVAIVREFVSPDLWHGKVRPHHSDVLARNGHGPSIEA